MNEASEFGLSSKIMNARSLIKLKANKKKSGLRHTDIYKIYIK